MSKTPQTNSTHTAQALRSDLAEQDCRRGSKSSLSQVRALSRDRSRNAASISRHPISRHPISYSLLHVFSYTHDPSHTSSSNSSLRQLLALHLFRSASPVLPPAKRATSGCLICRRLAARRARANGDDAGNAEHFQAVKGADPPHLVDVPLLALLKGCAPRQIRQRAASAKSIHLVGLDNVARGGVAMSSPTQSVQVCWHL